MQDPDLSRLVVHDRHLSHVRVPRVLAGAPAAELFRVLVGPLDPRRPHLQRRGHHSRTPDPEVPVDEDLQLEGPLDDPDLPGKNQEDHCSVQVRTSDTIWGHETGKIAY